METVIPKNYTFEIVLGTYEEFVLGFIFRDDSNELLESFATHSHQGSVRCIASTSTLIASGGSDEIIQLYNMASRKEAASIINHTGTITSLQFTPEQSHLISSSEDGSVAIYRVGSWQMEKIWNSAHKGSSVSCIAVHPSNKLALSLGQDKTLKTWNLVKGRVAYTTNLARLGKYMDAVLWSTDGSYFAVSSDNKIYIFDVNIAGVVITIECTSRITSMSFFDDSTICFGEENGWMVCHSIKLKAEQWRTKVGDVRVKCLSCVSPKWIVTGSSDGKIAVWEWEMDKDGPIQIASANVGCRITCLSVRVPMKTESD